MTPEEKQKLNEIAEQVAENNKMLHKLYRKARWGTIIRIFYWTIIIILTFGSYYFIQPYIDQLLKVYSGFGADVGTVKGATSGAADFLKNFGI